MSTNRIKLTEDHNLNVENIPNVPVCPMCTTVLENSSDDYKYKRINIDTRWFFCPDCGCNLGYHRMKKKWKVDPYDLDHNSRVREFFGLDPTNLE